MAMEAPFPGTSLLLQLISLPCSVCPTVCVHSWPLAGTERVDTATLSTVMKHCTEKPENTNPQNESSFRN